MSPFPTLSSVPSQTLARVWRAIRMRVKAVFVLLAWTALAWLPPAHATILWSDPGSRVIHATPEGSDILAGKAKRDDKANDVLFFKFHVDPLSDAANEPYYALFQLVESNQLRLAVGNAPEAWGYSACYTSETGPSNRAAGEFNLRSAHPEAAALGVFMPYELPDHNHERTIVFKVQYIPGGDDLVTAWLDPNLTHGATAENQPENITTKFKADASFDEIRLRHDGGGNGWMFSNMAIATSFNDFVVTHFWQTWWFTGLVLLGLVGSAAASVALAERKKFQRRLQFAEQEHTLERERARIARDLHDELGSLLTRISLLSGLLRTDKDNPAQVETHADKIAKNADQTVRALEEIVWAVRPGSDSLQSLVEYIAHFASELFEGDNARCRLDLPSNILPRPLPPEVRHDIFLVVKEALTNALKHAAAMEVRVQVKVSGNALVIIVQDDGLGYDPAASSVGGQHNGLENMRRRAEAMGGTLQMTSTPNMGTTVRLDVNLPGEAGNGQA